MKLTFLHISDLHYRPDWPEEIQMVCKKFIEDVATQAPRFENPYLVFSGDLVFAGEDATMYSAFMDRFATALDQAGFPRDRRICIPGNHDISQIALKPLVAMQKGTLGEMTDESAFNDNLPQLSDTIFGPKFAQYINCEALFARYTCCSSHLGGCGWDLQEELGLYCLNSALCSFAGLKDGTGTQISDRNRLLIDTRSLHRWMAETSATIRVLVMHHPIEWLAPWARVEIEKVISDKFHLVLSGHAHHGSSTWSSRGVAGSVFCTAPALFTRKADPLGYAFVTIDSNTGDVDVAYRQWTPNYKFVTGTSFSDNDAGTITFPAPVAGKPLPEVVIPVSRGRDTLSILEAEFQEATICYSSKKNIWINRDLASTPETVSERDGAVITNPTDLIHNLRSCIIHAPAQFGLTSLGRFLAIEHYRYAASGATLAMVDATAIPGHRQGVMSYIQDRCAELRIDPKLLAGIILDNWHNDKHAHRVLREIKTEFPGIHTILLHSSDDCSDIANAIDFGGLQIDSMYLWSLSRSQIRDLVVQYTRDMTFLDDDIVTEKIVADIDALNIHRTPLSCLLILKLAEQAFDDSPVNRTDMIGRVLYLLFYQFDKIPRYATRPDLKDCEYALGYVSEWMIRSGRTTFTKNEFYEKTQEYCKAQILDLDSEVLFSFLLSENILVRKGLDYGFRFSYWLYFFAAHRMHHSPPFAEYILSERRYSATPEIVEFYTGIDRRRSDAVVRLTEDLKQMDAGFLERTGISAEFNPYEDALWTPSDKSIGRMLELVTGSLAESTLPAEVKDAIADKSYDRSKPYRQDIARFVEHSTLVEMVHSMMGAARALRNSDHVSPQLKTELLQEVINCWIRVCQILIVLSPILAEEGIAIFEGMGFFLGKSFDDIPTKEKRWQAVMSVIADNVVRWYHEDIFSKKLGALFGKYVTAHQGKLGELLVLLLMTTQRPPGWEKEIENFITRTKKNSLYLFRVFTSLYGQFRIGFATERARQQLRRLAAMAIAKHDTGVKHPNIKLVQKASAALNSDLTEKNRKD